MFYVQSSIELLYTINHYYYYLFIFQFLRGQTNRHRKTRTGGRTSAYSWCTGKI